MIVGVGLDLVEIARVEALLDRHGAAFLDRVLHPDESRARIDTANGPTHVAGLFAAKEAVMKALGTGMAGAAFSEIAIRHTDAGQPYVELGGGAAEKASALGVSSWQLSISHSKQTAGAVAIALGG